MAVPPETNCIVRGCQSPKHAKNLCGMHYRRWKVTGRIGGPAKPKSGLEWLQEALSNRSRSGCWVPPWKSRTPAGYPLIRVEGKLHLATHVVMSLLGQPKPTGGMEILHACDNGSCVNPDHIRWGTHQENMQEARDRGRVPIAGSCSVEGCSDRHRARGLCFRHYMAEYRRGALA